VDKIEKIMQLLNEPHSYQVSYTNKRKPELQIMHLRVLKPNMLQWTSLNPMPLEQRFPSAGLWLF
jgi:hypothetical protein